MQPNRRSKRPPPGSFLAYAQSRHPALWTTLQAAAEQGIIVIDEQADAIAPTNRLAMAGANVHDILAIIINGWAEDSVDCDAHFSDLLRGSETDDQALQQDG